MAGRCRNLSSGQLAMAKHALTIVSYSSTGSLTFQSLQLPWIIIHYKAQANESRLAEVTSMAKSSIKLT